MDIEEILDIVLYEYTYEVKLKDVLQDMVNASNNRWDKRDMLKVVRYLL